MFEREMWSYSHIKFFMESLLARAAGFIEVSAEMEDRAVLTSQLNELTARVAYLEKFEAQILSAFPDIPALVEQALFTERKLFDERSRLAVQLLTSKDQQIDKLSKFCRTLTTDLEKDYHRLSDLNHQAGEELDALIKENSTLKRSNAEILEQVTSLQMHLNPKPSRSQSSQTIPAKSTASSYAQCDVDCFALQVEILSSEVAKLTMEYSGCKQTLDSEREDHAEVVQALLGKRKRWPNSSTSGEFDLLQRYLPTATLYSPHP